MKKRVFYVVCAVMFMVGILVPGSTLPVSAQPPEPEVHHEIDFQREPCVAGRPCQDENGYWYLVEDPDSTGVTRNELRAIGDSDEYGYQLSTAAYSWIDAVSSGTNTGIISGYEQVGPIPLPFDFPFYENTYSDVYIAGPGYLTFSEQWVNWQSEIPDSSEPNNIIAPFWAPYYYPNEGGTGQTFYKTGGVEPNRYFLVEYYRMSDMLGGLFTFEVLLFENGDIKFQYQSMNTGDEGYYCAESGIEDDLGEDGLNLGVWCGDYPEPNTAIIFYRPDPMARTKVHPLYLGDFTYASEVDEFIFTVKNSGDLGSDTYDFDVTIAPGGSSWTATLHDPDSGDPLTDTGPLSQGESKDVLAKVTAPAGAAAGEGVKILIDVTSSLDPTKTKTVTLESTVPAAFAQAFTDYSAGRVKNELNYSLNQLDVDVTQEWVYGYGPAVAETPDHHFVNVWREYDYVENDSRGYRLKYAVVDHMGKVVQPATELSGLYGEPYSYTNMNYPSIAVTPDGKVGVLWVRYIRNASEQYNYNVWFAVLNSNGSLAYSPVNLTNNNQWGNYQSGYLYYGNTKIEASADNRFMLAWTQGFHAQNYSDADVYYMIRNSNGAAITGGINMTADVENADDYGGLSLTALSGNKFYVFYNRYIQEEEYYYYLYPKYRVIDSSGNLTVGETDANLPRPWIEDSIQLPGGNIVLVHEYYEYNMNSTFAGYTILSGSNYNVLNTGTLSHPSASDVYPNTLAVTKTHDGRAIMTWMDEDMRYLYYALLHANGTVLSGPTIFNVFENGASINTDGYAITTNSWEPASGVDIMAEFEAPLYGAAPGGLAGVQVSYGNQGLTTAANVKLYLGLPAELSYSHDTSGVTPTIVGDTVTWDLGDLDFGDVGHFLVYLEVPSDATIGTFYDLDLEITSDGGDVDPSNNDDVCQVMAAELLFLPVIMR